MGRIPQKVICKASGRKETDCCPKHFTDNDHKVLLKEVLLKVKWEQIFQKIIWMGWGNKQTHLTFYAVVDPGFPEGGCGPIGGFGPPMQLLFVENVCKNK